MPASFGHQQFPEEIVISNQGAAQSAAIEFELDDLDAETAAWLNGQSNEIPDNLKDEILAMIRQRFLERRNERV